MMRKGYYGQWGGAFIPEVLQADFADLNRAYEAARADAGFWQEYVDLMGNYSCRPTPLIIMFRSWLERNKDM